MTVDKPATRLGAMLDSDLLCGPPPNEFVAAWPVPTPAVSYNYALNCFYCQDLPLPRQGEPSSLISPLTSDRVFISCIEHRVDDPAIPRVYRPLISFDAVELKK